jgi:hypothetical protein
MRAMGVVGAALGASAFLGASLGALAATTGAGPGVRPRQLLRSHRLIVLRGGSCIAFTALLAAVATILDVPHDRELLALTCLAVAVLLALASWVLLVEPDDDGHDDTPLDPAWWPDFERDFEEWTRRPRVPTETRS